MQVEMVIDSSSLIGGPEVKVVINMTVGVFWCAWIQSSVSLLGLVSGQGHHGVGVFGAVRTHIRWRYGGCACGSVQWILGVERLELFRLQL
jgi:hypothetical protein